MAVADLIKAFSLSECSLRSSSTSTTTQVVGLLSVLAISGSVALFTLAGTNKPKLTGEAARTDDDASRPLKMDGRDGLTRSNTTAAASSQTLETNGRDGLMVRAAEAESGPSEMGGRDGGVEGVKAGRKRVRFAGDVVEPRGNGHAYRMRFAQRQHEERVGQSKRVHPPSNSMPANRMALYRGLRQHQLRHSSSFFS